MNNFILLDGAYAIAFVVWIVLTFIISAIAIIASLKTNKENKRLKTENRCLAEENSALSDYYYKHQFKKNMKNNDVDFVTGDE